MSNESKYYFPWVRKGLKEGVTEEDQLGKIENADSLNKLRSSIKISADYKITSPAGSAESLPVPLSKEIQIIGPGDIVKVSAKAILKTVPVRGHQRFRKDFYPYIEFWESDFPWRYSPVVPNNNKLRPWLALLVCKTDDCMIDKSNERSTVSFNISNQQQYEQIFISPKDIWKTAHAQGMSQAEPEFSRLIALRRKNPKEPKEEEHKYNLEEDTNYVALLVPSFETGRLRGLGYDDETLKDIVAQMPAWEETLDAQKSKHPLKPLDFPVYYQWNFKTGGDSFEKLAEDLKFAAGFESGVDIDVSRMGNGFDYNTLKSVSAGSKRRNILRMPAAVTTAGIKDNPFPSISDEDEKALYENLKKLMDKNPVLAENRAEIEGDSLDEIGDDDPWVTPPLYGAKHIMATGIKDLGPATSASPQQPPPLDEPPRWLSQVNLDVHYRAVAGLGKRTVQIHQEEFVNRAWKQVEAVNAFNCELYQRLVSVNASDALKDKVLSRDEANSAQYIARLMRYLGSMKNAGLNGGSLKDILKKSNIPSAFATASFQNMADELAKKVPALNNTTLMENIAKNQIYSNMPDLDHAMTGIEQLYASKPYKVPLNNDPPVPLPHYIFNQDTYLPHTFVVAVCDEFWKKLQKGNLSKYFNFEVRKPNWGDEDNDIRSLYALKLKPISHNESDINKPNYIYTPDYKLLRYNNFFKELLKEWTLQWQFEIRYQFDPQNYNTLGLGPRGKRAAAYFNQDELKKQIYLDIYKKIGEFLKSEKDKYPCYGHTIDRVKYSEKTVESAMDNYFGPRALPKESLGSNARDIKYSYKMKRRSLDKQILGNPNVLVLNDEDFFKIFPYYLINSIVRVGGKEHCYIIPKRLLKKYSWNAIRLFVRLPDSFSGRDINIPDNYIEAQVVYQNEEYEYSDENIKCIETVQYSTTASSQTQSFNADVPFSKPKYKVSEGRSYREVPVLIDPVAPKSSPKPPQKLQLFTGGYGRYCYYHTQLYYPLLWKILELWKKGGGADDLCTALVSRIRPLWGISPAVPRAQKGAFMLNIRGHYQSCNNCESMKKEKCIKTGFPTECVFHFMLTQGIYRCEQDISEYLFEQPDRVELDVEAFTDQGGKIVHYEGYHFAYEIIQKLKRDPEKPTEYKLFKPWYELHKRSMELSAKIDKIQAKKEAAVTVVRPDLIDKDVNNWIDNADQSALYEQMIKVAKSYYAEFFANTVEGEKLRDEYIEELLHTKYPIMAYPIFPEPVYYYLKMFSDKFLMPCVDELPEDSVAMFLTNPAFTEAYLCGMNTEMARELLWREYPTDQRGSYFRKFWDSETSAADIHNENFFDVKPLHTWTSGDLGAHHMESKTGLILFIIRGKLMKQFPSTQVFLHKAKGIYNAATKDGTIEFDKGAAENKRIKKPEIQAYIREDIFLVGFKMEFEEALGNPEKNDFGYFLTFMEDVQDLNFEDKDTAEVRNAADAANTLINKPTLYGKHLSLFLNIK